MQVKALACELPSRYGVPLSRRSAEELAAEVIGGGLVASISGSTVWRWLTEDAIRPWFRRSWIFPRDPDFETKAGRGLDLYHGRYDGKLLGPNDFVLCAHEKTSIHARRRRHPTAPPQPRQITRVEHEYERLGAWAYLAAWDVHHARLFGRCERTTGIKPFGRLIKEIMTQPPYSESERVYCIVDNGIIPLRAAVDRTFPTPLPASPRTHPGSFARPRELAQPDGNLLLRRAAEGSHAE